MANGVRSTEISKFSLADEIIVNRRSSGLDETGRQTVTDLATQLANEGPIADALVGAASGIRQEATWAALDGIAGTTNGQAGRVTGGATTTHTDPVVGGSVKDQGEYAWSSSPAGWKRIGDIPLLGKASNAESIAGVNATKGLTAAAARASLDDRTNYMKTWQTVAPSLSAPYYWNRFTGVLTNSPGTDWRSQALIPGVPGDKLRITTAVRGASVAMVIWMNEAGAAIGFENPGVSGSTTNYADVEVTFPADAAFAGVTSYQTDPKILNMAMNPSLAPPAINALEVAAADVAGLRHEYLPTTKYTDDAYWLIAIGGPATLTLAPGVDWRALDPIPVVPGQTFKITGDTRATGTALVVWTDAGNVVLSRENVGVNMVTTSFVDYATTAPAGAAFLKVTTYGMTATVKAMGVDAKAAVPWKGKTIHTLGDSIVQGDGVNQWPSKVGFMLGAAINNQGEGSSTARAGRYHRKVAVTDPLGWTGASFNAVTRGLTQTLAEKEEFITNYESKWRDLLTASPAPPASLDDAAKTFIRSCSYENRLVPFLSGIDLLLIGHGYNDMSVGLEGTDLMALPDMEGDGPRILSGGVYINNPAYGTPNPQTRDRTYYRGAMNYLLDVFFAAKPKGRVALVGHYENARHPVIAQAQTAVAELWNIPIIKSWEFFGWSQQVIASGPDVGKTILKVWCPDDLHPHSDTTGGATTKQAELLFPKIRDLR